MNNEEIIKKAFSKAEKNGWTLYPYMRKHPSNVWLYSNWGHYEIIFSHEFSKAFWGEEHDWERVTTWNVECKNCGLCKAEGEIPVMKCWGHALQKMVLEENPLEYIEKFL